MPRNPPTPIVTHTFESPSSHGPLADAARVSEAWESVAPSFMATRSETGRTTVAAWAKGLPPGASVLELACGHGWPISQVLIDHGLTLHAIDASPTLVASFRTRFPNVPVRCETVEASDLFGRQFDAVIAVGLMFLLPVRTQEQLIEKVGDVLVAGGRFLFTAPKQAARWQDLSTSLWSESLGDDGYRLLLEQMGLHLVGTLVDEGGNHYYDYVQRTQGATLGMNRSPDSAS